MNKSDKEFCKNCKYYVALYTKEKTRFKTISGYCINDKTTAHNRKRIFLKDNCCELWEQNENVLIEKNKPVHEVIFAIQKQLTQILELLKNEE